MNKLVKILCCIAAVAVIFILRDMCCNNFFANISYDNNIDVIELFSLIASSIIAIWIGFTITNKLTEQNSAKQFLFNDIIKIEEQIDQLEQLYKEDNVNTTVVFKLITLIDSKLTVLKSSVISFGIKDVDFENLYQTYLDIFMISTNLDSEVGVISDSINPEVVKFRKHLRDIVAKINRYK
ncbi:MAG: hypothetical protein SNG38_03880 [Rikenellaceae bacterium]